MKAIILEDEMIAANRLKRILSKIDASVEVVATFESTHELTAFLQSNEHPDVIFMDINVTDGNSMELFDHNITKAKMIYTTAYDTFAVQAFRKNALDYLLKPIKVAELQDALERIHKTLGDHKTVSSQSRFLIKFGTKFHAIGIDDIAYIYSENKIGYFVKKDGIKIPSDYRLRDLIEKLPSDSFFRINRQFIIHIDAVAQLQTYTRSRIKLILNPPFPKDIVISTETTQRFKKWLKGPTL